MQAQLLLKFDETSVAEFSNAVPSQNTVMRFPRNPPLTNQEHTHQNDCVGVTSSISYLEVTKEYAVNWVKENIITVRGRAARFLSFSPYDLEDMVQEAYVAAIEALTVANDPQKRVPFLAAFWKIYNHKLCRMATNPSLRKLLGEEYGKSPANFLRYVDDPYDHAESENDHSESNHKPVKAWTSAESDEEMLLRLTEEIDQENEMRGLIATAMTKRQQEVWFYLIDCSYSITKTAEVLNVTKQTVSVIRDQGLRRIKKHCNKISSTQTLPHFPSQNDFLKKQKKSTNIQKVSDCSSIY